MDQKFNQKLEQTLLLTPQLRQAIKLLELNCIELEKLIKKEVEENPLLESKKNYKNTKQLSSNENTVENLEYKNFNIYNYLAKELANFNLNNKENQITKYIISNLDEYGFFTEDLNEVARTFSSNLIQIKELIQNLSSIAPYGIASKNIQESFKLQLKYQGLQNSVAYKIIDLYFKDLERFNIRKISKTLNIPTVKLKKELKIISKLHTSPFNFLTESNEETIEPDAFFQINNNKISFKLNEKYLPIIKINKEYSKLFNSNLKLKSYYSSANWLINSIKKRRSTLVKVLNSLIKHQSNYIINGNNYLKPLKLEDIALDIDMHISTVSRITSNKYIQTPRGVISLKSFFSTKISNTSAGSIKHKIKNLIKNEEIEKPLSDNKICEILNKQGYKIARRTAAKYREDLNIPSSSKRKKLFKLNQ